MINRLYLTGLLFVLAWGAMVSPAHGEILIATNSTWRWLKGTNEASSPISAWRAPAFNDSAWSLGQAPFWYDTQGRFTGNTHLPDMRLNYNCIFLRRPFVVSNPGAVASLVLTVVIDDGFIVWINGTEVQRYNVFAGEPVFSNGTPVAIDLQWQTYSLTNVGAYLVAGTNVMAVQVFNRNLNSSDLIIDLQLNSTVTDTTPPVITSVNPPAGTVNELNQITVTFSEPVTGVGFSDLLLNGVPAVSFSGSGATYTFFVEQPPGGSVEVTWAPETQIADFAGNPFNPAAPGATWQYQLVDTVPPTMAAQSPLPGVTVVVLPQVEITFSEPVTGVGAADLLINGSPATNVVGLQAGPYVFTFPSPAPGLVQLAWANGHGIADLASPPNAFTGGSWSVTLDPDFAADTIRINEFLASSSTGLLDEDDEAGDWIELYNFGEETIGLEGWSLSDVENDPNQWIFPAVALGPGEYLVVFATGKDRRPTVPGAFLHTNFRLGADGEFLGLFNASSPRQPVSVFAPAYPEQRTDTSYGYDSTDSLRYFATPTPGGPNGNSSISGVVAPVVANVSRGVFNHPFTLILATATPGATIRYTVNGSEPTLANGITYTGPLAITTTRTVRAAAFLTGQLPSRPVTHTYIFPEQVLSQPQNPLGFPTTWGSWSQVDYEMDSEIVNDVRFRSNILASLQSFPTLSIVMNSDDMFGGQGIYSNPTRQVPNNPLSQVEKACSAELIHPDGSPGFQIDCGIRIQGGASRTPNNNPKHSLRILFKNDYGPGKLNYPFFADSSVTSFDSIILRGEYNNSWIHWAPDQRLRGSNARDQWGRDTQIAMSGLGSHGNYVHLYINGLYWGLFNPSERMDAAFAAAHLGGEKEEYDAIKQPVTARDGDLVAWNAMMNIVRGGLASNAQYEALQQYLDVAHFADYMIVNIFGGNEDWPHNNWAAVRRRQSGAQFKFVCWDIERILESPTKTREFTVSNVDSPAEIYAALRNNAEFRLLFADRVHRHFFNGGALTVAANTNRYLALAARINQAVQAESARWGDYRRDVSVRNPPAYLFNHADHWLPELNRIVGTYFPQRSSFVLGQFQNINLYPAIAAPSFNQHGGRVAGGFPLTMSAPGGSIYYTTNGVDPRVYGTGGQAASARLYTGPVPLAASMVVKARVLSGGNWSALNEAEFQVGQLGVPLRITEIMYNPLPGGAAGEAFEFVELLNSGATAIDLSGFSFEGINFTFNVGASIAPGAVLVLASDKNPTGFAARYPGVTVAGWFGGNLSNGGERLAVLDAQGRAIVSVDYDDENGWPLEADGFGPSLEIIDVNGDPDDPANWRASSVLHGTPGTLIPAPALPVVRINEFMAENTGSVTNAGTFPDWAELHNTGGTVVDLGNWSLTDDSNPRRFVFPPGTTIPAGGYLIVWLDSATASPGLHAGFALSRGGEGLYLFDANTNRVDAVTFGPQLADYTVGRVGGEWRLGAPTPGAANVAAPVGNAADLVLNEWLADSPPGSEDWLELYNRNQTLPVGLRGLHLSTSNDVYRIGSLTFIAPGGHLQLWADQLPGPGHLDFRLPAEGGMIALHDGSGLEVDRIEYDLQSEGVSEGRLPDGGANIVPFAGSTSPGASNYVVAYAGPGLNEVMARNQSAVPDSAGRFVDWVELYNAGGTTFDLSGMSLSVDLRTPGQWIFPPGTTIPAGGYLIVWCDGTRPASTAFEPELNTGRSINGSSGAVYLFNALGHQVDAVEFGFQIADRTIGRSAGQWRLLASPTPGAANAAPTALGPVNGLRINEWMARQPSGDDWFELFNPDPLPVELSGLYLTDDPSIFGQRRFQAPPLSFIGGRGFVQWIASGSPSQGRHHVNFSLSGDGEMIGLYGSNLALIDAVYFGLQLSGVSQGRLPDGGNLIVSFPTTATPGLSNFLPLDHVVINEVLTHTDEPLEDAIELHNLTGTNVDIGGWFLSEYPANLKMYRIPTSTLLTPHGFRVYYEADFNGGPDSLVPFALSSSRGDSVLLSAADGAGNLTGYRAEVHFGPAANGVSFGRHVTSTGVDFTAMSARTFGVDDPVSVVNFRQGTGRTNAAPLVGPIVINEFMYHPPGDLDAETNAANAEYLELYNLTDASVPLFDPNHPTNRWALLEGVRYTFPTNIVMPARGYLILVGFDPVTNAAALSAFRHQYRLPDTVPVLGPYDGRLNNTGESLELYQPDPPEPSGPDAGLVPMILVDRVNHSHLFPWPGGLANGSGASLQRIAPTDYGNDPAHWQAAAPAAGRANLPVDLDSDGDGMPDWWELAHGFDPQNPADAQLDSDGNGLSNRQEYLAGTNPRDAASSLKIQAVEMAGQLRLRFTAMPGRAYTVEHTDNLPAGPWQKLSDVPLDWTTREIEISDPAVPLPWQRLYRIRVQQPTM